ncbi:transporter [Paracoccus gahaiensis]|uniref:Transporter n=1 Tax=Paracoccus gahaiensis TaxID=1706839 RepID=A0A4U0RE04_9RHOB|nr:transporter [Paracoccus gahaiensis]TJZ93485.1 transporter [Paracoccus gahaiensis]
MVLTNSLVLLAVVTALTIGGDYLIKSATIHVAGMGSGLFLVAVALYALSAFGWFFLIRHHPLTWIAVTYSGATLILLTLLGVIVFDEDLGWRDIAAVAMALGAILLVETS